MDQREWEHLTANLVGAHLLNYKALPNNIYNVGNSTHSASCSAPDTLWDKNIILLNNDEATVLTM